MNAPLPASSQFADVSPGTLQQFTTLLLERLAASELPELGGMIRLHGRWTDPGRASGKSYYGAKIVDDGGAQAKVEILASLVASRGVLPGHLVIATGRLAVRSTNYGLEVRLVATDIELGNQEQAAKTEIAQQGRMTIERLRSIPMRRVPFPDRDSVSVTLIHSNSAAAQVTQDCMAELSKLGDSVGVFPVKVNMLDPVAIATAIREANSDDIVMIIRGGGDAADFEVFDDPRVVTALASQHAHRVVGLGHTGNSTLLDLVCDFSAYTPAQAGAYVRERVQQRHLIQEETVREMRLLNERIEYLQKQRELTDKQLALANAFVTAAKGSRRLLAAAMFAAGAAIVFLIRYLPS